MKMLCSLVLVAATAACAGRAPSSGAAEGAAPAASPARRNPNLISREELLDPRVRARNVLDVIKELRPNFLTERGKNSMSDPEAGKVHASINGLGVVALEELGGILTNSVVEIQFLNPGAAMQRFGGAAREGPVIVVKTM
jgi:hypothetical protein